MDTNDRQAIAGLFDKLSQVERQMPDRDPEAERFIGDAIARQPGAPYYMAQTVVVQEYALSTAQSRIEQLEAELQAARSEAQGGGFLAGLFGGGTAPRRQAQPPRQMPQGAPGGFLAGAGQTALGVAGGMLIANALAGTLAGEAEAAEPPPEEDPDLGGTGFDDGGDW
jgi:uncharacterized protein